MDISPRLRMRHFRVFMALCEYKTLTNAASELGTAQPALSRTLRELEDEIGALVFERHSNGLRLTENGERLRQYLAVAMSQIEDGVRAARGKEKDERVNVGMMPNVARSLVPLALAKFKTEHPKITVQIHVATIHELAERCRKNELDFIVSRQLSLESQAGFVFEQLYTEPLIFVAGQGHPLQAREGISLTELKDYTIFLPPPGTIIRQEFDRFAFRYGAGGFDNRVETVSYELVRQYLKTNDAVACMPFGAASNEIKDGQLVKLDVNGDILQGAVGLSSYSTSQQNPAARLFAAALRQTAKDLQ